MNLAYRPSHSIRSKRGVAIFLFVLKLFVTRCNQHAGIYYRVLMTLLILLLIEVPFMVARTVSADNQAYGLWHVEQNRQAKK